MIGCHILNPSSWNRRSAIYFRGVAEFMRGLDNGTDKRHRISAKNQF